VLEWPRSRELASAEGTNDINDTLFEETESESEKHDFLHQNAVAPLFNRNHPIRTELEVSRWIDGPDIAPPRSPLRALFVFYRVEELLVD
jgi:hypothetical protein